MILVTGAAGFIGSHVSLALLQQGHEVLGLDNLNDYYEVSLKEARLARLAPFQRFELCKLNIADQRALSSIFARYPIQSVIHLAAQAGVRYSLINPQAYIDSNVVGFTNMLECCRTAKVEHLVFASSSSVYGLNKRMPFSVRDNVDHPVSLYAATKKSNELEAHAYAHLYNVSCTGLRFFTVYGPWGRPDMACLCLRVQFWRELRLLSTTTDRCNGTLPISMTSWKASFGSGESRRVPIRTGPGMRPIPTPVQRPIAFTTSAIINRCRCYM